MFISIFRIKSLLSNSNFVFNKKIFLLSFFVIFITFNIFSQYPFKKNEGQWNKKINYKSEFRGGNLFIEDGVLNYNFYDTKELDEYIYSHHKKQFYDDSREIIIHGHCLKTNFINSNKNLFFTENDRIEEYFNYYLGKDKSKWARKVRAYNSLKLNNLYEDIDLEIITKENAYKYNLIVKSNADINLIEIEYKGADKVFIENGNLHIQTSVNTIIEQKPYAYQIVDGEKDAIECQFVLKNGIISFYFPQGYNEAKELIIDPYIVFSRISGSTSDNFGYSATYDSKGNAYGAGSVFTFGFITTPGAFDLTYNGSGANNTDVGIVKYSSDGLQRLYSTYLGGAETDLPHSLVVNSRDELFILGTTGSANFPMASSIGSYDNSFAGGSNINLTNGIGVIYPNGSDIFIARFKEDGSDLLASTYLGGLENDGLDLSNSLNFNYADQIRGEVLMDENDNCYIVSCTYSSDFPFVNGFQDTLSGNLDGIIVKMDENLSTILWSSFLGGTNDDAIYSIDFDKDENLVIAGGTNSDDFNLLNPYQGTFGGVVDGFISIVHSSGNGLINSTYYGSINYDQIYFVELGNDDNVHVFGQTRAPEDSLIFNALYNVPNGGQFLSKFNSTIDTLVWSTRFGSGTGQPDISPTAFLVDLCDRIFLSGWGSIITNASNISGTNGLEVTSDAIDPTTDGNDFYFMVLKDDASALVYASFFGGVHSRDHVDGGTSRFDKKGVIYQAVCASCGSSNDDFPIVPPNQNWHVGSNNCNLGVVKYAFSPPSIIADFVLPPIGCAPQDLHFENTSHTAFDDTTNVDFVWTVEGQTFNSYHLDYSFANAGVYEIQLVAIEPLSCNKIDSITKQIVIIGDSTHLLPDVGVCQGNATQIGITPLVAGDVVYSWSPDYFLSSTTIANPFANPLVDTTYYLYVSNGSCVDTFIQNVVLESLNIDILPFDTVCLESNIEIQATFENGALYEWSPEEVIINGQGTNTVIVYAENSNQEVSVLVTDLNGCTDMETINLITIDDIPEVETTADPDTIEAGQSSQLLAESLDATSFLWEANSNFTSLAIPNPNAENIQETTTYHVIVEKLTTSNVVCPKKDSVTVYVVIPECLDGKFFIPNAFSPNGDGENDVFKVRTTLVNIEDFYLAVFDRWGNKIFDTTDKTIGWDGTYKGAELTPNVYGWYTSGICPNGEDFLLKGNVTLLK